MVVLGTREDIFPHIMRGMNTLRKEKILYDVCVKVGGQEITAHKCVLAPVSDYFKSLFTGPFKTDEAIVQIDFTSVALDVESTEAVFDYLYTGTININDGNVEGILKLASFLLIKQLQGICIQFIAQSSDLTSFLRYFQFSVDYMAPDAEQIVYKVVKTRFHDWFIFNDSTKQISPCYLQKLHEAYDIFENCTKIDILSFIVDWVTNGQTEDHYSLGLQILDDHFVENSSFEYYESDQEFQSDHRSEGDVNPKMKGVAQENKVVKPDQEPNSNQSQQTQNQVEEHCKPQLSDNSKADQLQNVDGKEMCDGESRITEAIPTNTATEPDCRDEEQPSDDEQPRFRQRLGFNIPLTVEKIKSQLESEGDESSFNEKCKQIINKKFCSIPAIKEKSNASCSESIVDLPEPDTEQVIIAVTPKKCLKEFLAGSTRFELEISIERDNAIFDICVYIPRTQSWFYIEEGKNDDIFKDIAHKNSEWPINFCMNDKLCCVSLNQNCLYMYSLKQDRDRPCASRWSSVSYEYLVRQLNDYDIEFDEGSDVRLCYDGKNVYLVLKMKSSDDWAENRKVKFICYRLSKKQSWEFLLELQADDDLDIYESTLFDVHVSSDLNEMLIVVQGHQFHVLRVNLGNKSYILQGNILDGENELNNESEMSWLPHPNFWVMRNRNRVSFVDEIYSDALDKICYRNIMIKDEEEMSVDFTEHRKIEIQLPRGYHLDRKSKLSHSVGAGSAAWLYVSDGKFQTSLYEIGLSKYMGMLNIDRHSPPPFQSVTILAAGVVKRDILDNLKPVYTFLQE